MFTIYIYIYIYIFNPTILVTEDEMGGWHHRLNGHKFEQAPGVADGWEIHVNTWLIHVNV